MKKDTNIDIIANLKKQLEYKENAITNLSRTVDMQKIEIHNWKEMAQSSDFIGGNKIIYRDEYFRLKEKVFIFEIMIENNKDIINKLINPELVLKPITPQPLLG